MPRMRRIPAAEANDLLSPVHDRMPVILPRGLESFWLDHHVQDHVALSDILTPYPPDAWKPTRSPV